MSQDNLITLACTECKEQNYHVHKNVKKLKGRLELMKLCPKCGKHTKHKEDK